ncbi:hypothetical protein ECE50_005045 [Chitinophaga sp. Mgbs1]|uniref:Uncharacterized protein n=1 Tax=Chitinophaga solisilvae TaxID=1233460 RepID=A0A3S1BNG7_9BACT|nr:hypothetical protein [Chitinophaga solisilvae]
MERFENLEDIWNSQPQPPALSAADIELKARVQAKAIKAKHRWTIIIISVTVLVLAAYFIRIAAYSDRILFTGLGIMITMLLLRIIMEYRSIRKLNTLSAETSFTEYADKLQAFYQWRKKIHLVLTPIVYGLYIAGFILLLPVFKAAFSTGFFWYILISGTAFFVVFGFFMARQIKKELTILALLNSKFSETAGSSA